MPRLAAVRRWILVVTLLLAFAPLCAAAVVVDGPYLQRAGTEGWIAQWIESVDGQERARRESIPPGGEVTIPAVDRFPAFIVRPRPPAAIAPDEVTVTTGAPLFVVADTHGEYEILVRLLQNQGVIDGNLQWSFGTGHLVVLGDILDRGDHQTEILWLFYALEAAAEAAGGGVHVLLGNHETHGSLSGETRGLHSKYPRVAQALGVASYADLFGQDSVLGQWLRSRPVVLKFNDLLLMHGGISSDTVARGLTPARINSAVREVLDGAVDRKKSELHEFLMGARSPLGYRGYFPMSDAWPDATFDDVNAALRHFGVRMILVGHTAVPEATPLYGGRVMAVQVFPKWDEATGAPLMGAVVRTGGRWHRARVEGGREPLETEY